MLIYLKKYLPIIFIGLIMATTVTPMVSSFVGAPTGVAEAQDQKPDCSGGGFFSIGSFACEIGTLLVYTIGFRITQWLTAQTANILDHIIYLSIQSETYSGSGFILQGWSLLRDLANILFIGGLIYVAALWIFGQKKPKILAMVIVGAILVNFSLFFSRVIIDAGNLLTYAFYNQIAITVDDGGTEYELGDVSQGDKAKISVGLTQKINPQNFLLVKAPQGTQLHEQQFFLIYSVMTVVNLIIMGVFISMIFLMVGRIVGLMLGMVIGPLAIASLGWPGMQGKKTIGFNSWLHDLINNAFVAPIFLFFIYLTILFIERGTYSQVGLAGSSVSLTLGGVFVDIVVPLSIVVGIILIGQKVTKGMSSSIASQVSDVVGKVTGSVVGIGATAGIAAATGGAAFLGRNTFGRFGASQLEKGNNNYVTRLMAKGSYDVRNTKAYGATSWAAGQAGKGISKGLGDSSFKPNINLESGTIGGKLGPRAGLGGRLKSGIKDAELKMNQIKVTSKNTKKVVGLLTKRREAYDKAVDIFETTYAGGTGDPRKIEEKLQILIDKYHLLADVSPGTVEKPPSAVHAATTMGYAFPLHDKANIHTIISSVGGSKPIGNNEAQRIIKRLERYSKTEKQVKNLKDAQAAIRASDDSKK